MPREKIESTKTKGPGLFSKIMLLGILPALYAIILGMTILHFSGISIAKQLNWAEKQIQPLMHKQAKAEKVQKTTKKKAASAVTPVKKSSTPAATAKNTSTGQSNTQSKTQAAQAAADSLSNMDPESAAKLLMNMNEANALKNLKTLTADVQSSIIAEMPADEGARLMVALEENSEPSLTTYSSSQLYKHMKPDQIASILKGITNNAEVLRQIKKMDPDTASKVLSQLDPKVAGWVVTQMH